MDDPATFEKTLQDYRNAYIAIHMARANPNTLDGPRNAILAQIERLQKIVDSESAEIKNFSEKARLANSDIAKTAEQARSLKNKRQYAGDDLSLTKHVFGETPPSPDWSPLYRRIGIVGGLVIAVLAVRMMRV